MENTETQEMYLVTIDRLRKRYGKVRSIDIATERGFGKSTVHAGMKNLESMGLINFDASDITLTEEGQKVADNIEKKHVLVIRMLTLLGMDEKKAEENACQLEHAISDEVYDLLSHHLAFAEKVSELIAFKKDTLMGK